jgi:hypothetical protein
MHAIWDFILTYGQWFLVPAVGAFAVWIAKHMDKEGEAYLMTEIEMLHDKINATEVGSAIDADDAIIHILESYIPEVVHEFDETIKTEVSNGHISSLDWIDLGKRLWTKAKTEVCDGAVNYWEASGKKDAEAIAALVAKKFFYKQSALQKGLIVPHD